MMLSLSLLVFNVSAMQQDNINSFLQSISNSSQKQDFAQSKQNSSAQAESSFFKSLSDIKRKRAQQQKDIQQEKQKQQQAELAAINTISNLYNNPKYHQAMDILNDPTLQASYEHDLNSIRLFFFDYSQNVISKYHTQQKKPSSEQQNISSFLSSLSKDATNQSDSSSNKNKKNSISSASKVSSFLSSLKG